VAGYVAALMIRSRRSSVSWHRPNDFVSAVLHSYDSEAPKLGCHLVVIDDCGRETKTDFCEALCAFIDDTDTPFVLTTNMQKEAFRKHYDERLIDRLNHCAKALAVKGDSRRKKGDF
jgi:DNA replication protein DnaC